MIDWIKVTIAASNVNAACVPESASALQLLKVFIKYVHDHPEQMHERHDVVLYRSLRGAFCRAEGK